MSEPAAISPGQVVNATNPPCDRQTRLSIPTGLVLYFSVDLWVLGGMRQSSLRPFPIVETRALWKLIWFKHTDSTASPHAYRMRVADKKVLILTSSTCLALCPYLFTGPDSFYPHNNFPLKNTALFCNLALTSSSPDTGHICKTLQFIESGGQGGAQGTLEVPLPFVPIHGRNISSQPYLPLAPWVPDLKHS